MNENYKIVFKKHTDMFNLTLRIHLPIKKLMCVFCLLACSLLSFGQAYQLMYSNRIAMYKDVQGNYSVYKPDFVLALGSDTVLKNYTHLDDSALNHRVMNGYYCFTHKDGFGSQIYVKQGPMSYIITGRGDSLALKTISQPGDQWILTSFSDGNHIRAQVVSNTPDTVLGIADTLKHISLQMEDSLNNQITHPVNFLFFEISEKFGLYRFPYLRNFPDSSRMYLLAGIDSGMQAGRSRPLPEAIYNYDVGDKFHFRQIWYTSNVDHLDYTKRTVLSKVVQPLSVEYTFFDSSLYITGGWMGHSERFDTATVSTIIGFDTWDCSQVFNAMPYLQYENTYQNWHTFSCGNRIAVDIQNCVEWAGINCVNLNVAGCGGCIHLNATFAEGLGEVSHYNFDTQFTHPDNFDLLYYKKHTDSCGTPLDFSLLIDAIPDLSTFSINPFPNPFSSRLHLTLPGVEHGNLSLLDCTGKEVIKQYFYGTEIDLPTQALSNGLYLLRIESEGRIKSWKVMKE